MNRDNEISILLPDARQCYQSGEELCGSIQLRLYSQVDVEELVVVFYGVEQTNLPERPQENNNFITKAISLELQNKEQSQDTNLLNIGLHKVPFSMRLPERLSPTFIHEKSFGFIKYFLQVTFTTAKNSHENYQSETKTLECVKTEVPVSVRGSSLHFSDPDCLDQSIGDISSIADKNHRIECIASLDKKIYRPGSAPNLNINILNASESRVSSVITKLVQNIQFGSNENEIVLLDEYVELGYTRAGMVLPNSRLIDKRVLKIPLDAVESINQQQYPKLRLISIQYYVDVLVDSQTTNPLHLKVPLIISNSSDGDDTHSISDALNEQCTQYVAEINTFPTPKGQDELQSSYRGYGVKTNTDLVSISSLLRSEISKSDMPTPLRYQNERPYLMDSPVCSHLTLDGIHAPSSIPRSPRDKHTHDLKYHPLSNTSDKGDKVTSQQQETQKMDLNTNINQNEVSIQTDILVENNEGTHHSEGEAKMVIYLDSPMHKEFFSTEETRVEEPEYSSLTNEKLEQDELESNKNNDLITVSRDDETLGYNNRENGINSLSSDLSRNRSSGSPVIETVEIGFENGGRYVGQLNEDGVMNGLGDYFYPNGSVYRGHWSSGLRHGAGRLEYSDQSVYHGEWFNDLRHGFGIYTTEHYQYEGHWSFNQKHGEGIISYSNGERYDGEWLSNYPSGIGEYIFRDGSKYSGQFAKGLRHGHGSLFYSDGCTIYEGEWVFDKKNGYARITFINGVYDGEVKNDVKEGMGTYRYNNGDSYEGYWFQNKKHGKGVYKFNEGGLYNGSWVCGVKQGEGVLEMPDGTLYAENWNNGALTSKVRLDNDRNPQS